MSASRIIICVLAALVLAGSVFAEVPRTVSYQGYLTRDDGTPLDTTVDLTFTLYMDTTGLSQFWMEKHEDVDVTGGVFSVLLGSQNKFPEMTFDGDMHGLTIHVGSGPEMLPPVPIVSVVYAFRALVADSALNASVAPGSIDSTELADGGVSFADMGQNAADDGQVMKYSSKAGGWIPANDEEGTSGTAGGWTDLGSVVRQQTLTDLVSLGTPSPLGKLHIQVDDVDLPEIHLNGSGRDITWQTGQALQFGEWDGSIFEEHARIHSNGRMGLGTNSALAHLHIEGEDQAMTSAAVAFDDFIIEDQDAVMGLYSNEAGNAGSAFSLAEVNGSTGAFVDKWGFARQTTGGGSDLRITYGTEPHPYDNYIYMTIQPNGNVGIGDNTPEDAKLKVSTGLDCAIHGTSYIYSSADSCVGVMGTAGVGFPGYPVGVIGKAPTGTGVLGVGDNDPGGHGVIGRGLIGLKGEAMDEIYSFGVVGEGSSSPYSMGVHGTTEATNGTGVKGESFNGSAIAVHAVAHGAAGRAVRGEALDDGAGSTAACGWFSSAAGWGRGVRADCSGTNGYGVYAVASGTNGKGIFAQGGTSGHAAVFRGNVLIQARSDGSSVLELGEGLDYAEGFDVTGGERIAPGMVLAIDPEHPGRLALTEEAYDTKVAGIVAGANGLGSGVRLGAQQFDQDVALAGRVYCFADASGGAIEPGDLLTTSDKPGHAMKVGDYTRAQGAILGKAMEPLAQGETGLILVLVTLQ